MDTHQCSCGAHVNNAPVREQPLPPDSFIMSLLNGNVPEEQIYILGIYTDRDLHLMLADLVVCGGELVPGSGWDN
jgi:hypothetical protein